MCVLPSNGFDCVFLTSFVTHNKTLQTLLTVKLFKFVYFNFRGFSKIFYIRGYVDSWDSMLQSVHIYMGQIFVELLI
jgi:hypothetical protein